MLQRALEIDPGLTEARKALAQSHLSGSDVAAAGRELEQLLDTPGGCDGECHLLLATVKIRFNDKEGAAEVINRGLKLFAGSTDYLKGLALLLLETSPNQQQTAQVIGKIAELLPADVEAKRLKAELELINGRTDECLELLTQALELKPDERGRMRIAALLGRAEESRSNYDRAATAFRISWELNCKQTPPDHETAISYAAFLSNRQRYEAALQVIERILEWNPIYGPAYWEKAKIHNRRGESEKAVEAAKQALNYLAADKRRQRGAHTMLVKNYARLGRHEEAKYHQRWLEEDRDRF